MAPLQKQVKALFKILNVEPDRVLSGNLIPFRTQKEADIKDMKREIGFATELWGPILTSRKLRIVTMGRHAKEAVVSILSAKPNGEPVSTGWGNIKASFYNYCKHGEKQGEICCLPHLSRYRIFRREKIELLELEEKLATMCQ